MLRDVDCHIPALCKVIRNHTYQQVTWRSASFSTQQSGEEPTGTLEEDFLKSTVTAALGAGLVYAAIFIAAYIKKRPPIFAGDAWLFAPTGFLLGPTGLTFALFVNIPLAIAHRYYLAKKRNRSMWRSYAPVAPAYCLAVGIVFGMQVHMGEML